MASLSGKGKVVFYGLLATNTIVYGACVYRQCNYHTMITSVFSHQSFDHFLFNMIGLYSFGHHLVMHLGPLRFLTLYGLGGLVSSGCQLLLYNKIPHNWPSNRDYSWYSKSLGASGAINAIIAYSILLSPTSILLIYFKPVPAAVAGLGIISMDAYGLYYGGTGIGHGAHLGGAVFGAAYFLATRRFPPLRR